MKQRYSLFGTLLFSFVYIFESSFFIGKEEEPGISGEDLYLDKSFFECARQSSCWDVPKKAKEKTTNEVWKKVVYRSCKEAWRPGNLKEETYLIQFEGTSVPVEVRCAQQNGTMVVLFDHDSETRMNVTGFEPPGAYRHIITYKNPLRDVISVVDKLGECRQWTRVDCSGMILISNTGQHFGYIVDRKGDQMKYFGGGNSTGTGCQCGMTKSCVKAHLPCNCDANQMKWQFDEGYVTEQNRLPITEIRLGDTGNNEYGSHIIGALECFE
ncbi:contactin-associated protein 1-like [Rhopilema esculentum]|uniref:contactin-associated protein 1-like n=1 Tax=Rhopilema esculentum TaxID=499914 RepID=UPI0031D825B2